MWSSGITIDAGKTGLGDWVVEYASLKGICNSKYYQRQYDFVKHPSSRVSSSFVTNVTEASERIYCLIPPQAPKPAFRASLTEGLAIHLALYQVVSEPRSICRTSISSANGVDASGTGPVECSGIRCVLHLAVVAASRRIRYRELRIRCEIASQEEITGLLPHRPNTLLHNGVFGLSISNLLCGTCTGGGVGRLLFFFSPCMLPSLLTLPSRASSLTAANVFFGNPCGGALEERSAVLIFDADGRSGSLRDSSIGENVILCGVRGVITRVRPVPTLFTDLRRVAATRHWRFLAR